MADLIERIPVNSKAVRSIGYEPITRTLDIEFHSGVYRYNDVPETEYEGLLHAESIGRAVMAFKATYVGMRVKE
ncbi:MAG: hypothetical protein NVSMB31_01360 [Vulcanimicrobiaceae bacterium]